MFSFIKPTTKWRPKNRLQQVSTTVFILVFAGIGSYLMFRSFAASPPKPNHSHANSAIFGRLRLLDQQLELGSADLSHNPIKKAKLEPQLRAIAKSRKQDILNLIKTDPALARSVILSNTALATLGKSGANVEKAVSLSGKYGMKQIDDSSGDHIYSQITVSDKTYTLDTEQVIPKNITVGATIGVSGYLLDDQLLVAAAPGTDPSFSTTYT